jgi:hypothetical protein
MFDSLINPFFAAIYVNLSAASYAWTGTRSRHLPFKYRQITICGLRGVKIWPQFDCIALFERIGTYVATRWSLRDLFLITKHISPAYTYYRLSPKNATIAKKRRHYCYRNAAFCRDRPSFTAALSKTDWYNRSEHTRASPTWVSFTPNNEGYAGEHTRIRDGAYPNPWNG